MQISCIRLFWSRVRCAPGDALTILRGLLVGAGVAGKLTADAHLAALAIEHGCALHSNDADFGRFSGLRWVNPLG